MALIDTLLKTLTNPYLLAAAGGVGGYYVKGRDAQGITRYVWVGGGIVAGYTLGKTLQRSLQPAQVAARAVAPAVAAAARQTAAAAAALPAHQEETIDLTDGADVDTLFAQPAAAPAMRAQPSPTQAVSAPTQPVSGNHLGSLSGGLEGDLSDSFGTFAESTLEADEAQLQELLEESRRRSN